MKKEDITGLLVYLLILAFAIVFGLVVLQSYASKSGLDRVTYIFFVLGAIVSGVILNAIVFELGHVVGAKTGGYKVLSCNVLGFMFYLKDDKRKFKYGSFDGLTGETKIIPNKEYKKEHNPVPYLTFGMMFFAIVFAIEIIIFVILKGKGTTAMNVGYFLLVMGVVGFMILIYDIVPVKLDSMTDGYRLLLLSNKNNKEAFNELLRVEYEISIGNKDVEIKTFDNITNFTADLNLNKVYVLLDNKQYEEATKLIDMIINGKEGISYKVYMRAVAQKIYIELMTKPTEEARVFYDSEVPPDVRRDISEDVSMASIRAYLLMSGLLDKSQSEVERTLNKVLKAFKHTSKDRQPIELKLYNEALQKIIDAHPKWGLEGFLLSETK